MTGNMEENKTEKQPETAKKNERGRKESQPLTPEEIRKRRKMLVYPLLFLVFGVAMWLIFAPSDEGESLQDGFNVEVPMPEEKNLPSDKRAAYEQQDFERKQRDVKSPLPIGIMYTSSSFAQNFSRRKPSMMANFVLYRKRQLHRLENERSQFRRGLFCV